MKIAVLTSGGDAPGMNQAVRAIVKTAAFKGHEVYGVYEGYKGLVEDNLVLLTPEIVDKYLFESGTFLKSARLPEFQQEAVQRKAEKNLEKRGINHLVVIGGDGSYHAAERISNHGFKVIGLPGTIDNDLGGTDFTIGFFTAQNTICRSLEEITDTAKSHNRCYVVETMGRACGDLALYSAMISGVASVVTQQHKLSTKQIIQDVKNAFAKKQHAIVVVTENLLDVHQLSKDIEKATGIVTRPSVLGYIQRGGRPVPEDRILATRLGGKVVEYFEQDIHGVAVGIKGNEVVTVSIHDAITIRDDRTKDYEFVKQLY